MATAKQITINVQHGSDRTVYATWQWSYKTSNVERTDYYAVQWTYSTGNGVAFSGSDSSVTSRQSVYNAPSNAISVSFRVRPVSKTYTTGKKKKKKTVAYFTATWSSWVTYRFSASTKPDKPSTPTVSIDKYTLTASVSNYSDSRANRICFQIVKNDASVFKTLYANLKTTAARVSQSVDAGSRYKVRCRAEKYKTVNTTKVVNKKKTTVSTIKVVAYSDWTEYSNNENTIPNKPTIVFTETVSGSTVKRTKALSSTSIEVWCTAVSTATGYTVEYTDDKRYFDSSSETHTVSSSVRHAEITGLESGKTWYFRMKASNGSGDSGYSAIASLVIGTTPAAPTTWSETSTVTVGEAVRLYWSHNSEDESEEKGAQIEITVNNDTANKQIVTRYTGTGITGTSKTDTVYPNSGVTSANIGDLYLNTSTFYYYRCTLAGNASTAKWVYVGSLGSYIGYYPYSTSSLTEGATVKWRVRTKGITNTWGPYSTSRTITVYAPPVISIELFPVVAVDEEGEPSEYGEAVETIESYPFVMRAEAGPITQNAVGYIVSIVAKNSYETISQTGEIVQVVAGEEIFNQYYAAISNGLDVLFSAGNLDLANGEEYTISCVVAMDSGLTATDSMDFDVAWEEEEYEPNAEIGLGMADYTALIQPYCRYMSYEETPAENEGELVENVTLSVYRRTYDGKFVEIATGLQNDGVISITDPHPTLDYARYRIVATSTITGKVSYYDVPGLPFDEITGIVIQWDEEWQDFNKEMIDDENAAVEEEESYSSSMLVLPYNVDVADSHAPDVVFAKYIGREHPTSYYGTQLGITSRWSTEIPADDEETIYALRRLAVYNGDVYVREPSGSGYWAQVIVGLDIKHMALTVPVSLDITRVDGGM